MGRGGTFKLVLLHGLHDPRLANQFTPLSLIEHAVVELAHPADVIRYPWGHEIDPGDAVFRALTGSLGAWGAPRLNSFLAAQLDRSDIELIVGGFSGGGWILTSCLAGAHPDLKQRVRFAFTIAS